MDYKTYQIQSFTTVAYPIIFGNRSVYPATGAADEAGEVLGKLKKMHRDNGGLIDGATKYGLRQEMGDCLWNLCQLVTEKGSSLPAVMEQAEQVAAGFGNVDPLAAGLKLVHMTGSIANIYSEAIMGRTLPDLAAAGPGHQVHTLILSALTWLVVLGNNLGISMEEVMIGNLDKLSYRLAANKVNGSGDYR